MQDNLDQEEQTILDAFEQHALQSVADLEEQRQLAMLAARNTTQKTRRINLRLTERDFYLAHVKASEEGLPYQTLLASIIHKYLTGRLVDRTS